MTVDKAITLIASFFLVFGLPFVHFYLKTVENPFLSIYIEDGNAFHQMGAHLLSPYHYIIDGKKGLKTPEDAKERYAFKERFNYEDGFELKLTAFLFLLPKTFYEGVFLNALSFLFQDQRSQFQEIKKCLECRDLHSNEAYYREIGMPEFKDETLVLAKDYYERRPGDENHLKKEKEALKEIVAILEKENIFYFVDCGTCLGAYRYGGVIPWDNDVDIAILNPDFENVKRVLKANLDPNLYLVDDWSSRGKQDSYLKVYVKESASLIDIYTYIIDYENRTLKYILSNEDNIFLTKEWKEKERIYKEPISFDLVFPPRRGTFDGISVMLPNKTEEFLKKRYGENIEPNMIYDPKTQSYIKDLNHPYWSAR